MLPDAKAAHVLPMQVIAALAQLGRLGKTFDLVLMDPPYAQNLVPQTLEALCAHALLRKDGLIVAEHAGAQPPPQPPALLAQHQHRRWGDVAASLFVPV